MRRSGSVVRLALLALIVSALGVLAASLPGRAYSGTDGSFARRLIITERDSGKTFKVSPQTLVSLRLSDSEVWTQPRVRGKVVKLVAVPYFRDPGFSEWTIRIVGVGTATISSSGAPNCSGGPCPAALQQFAVKIVVRKPRTTPSG